LLFSVCLVALAFSSCDRVDRDAQMGLNEELNATNTMTPKCDVVPPDCKEETAWADGLRYTARGNWATYVTTPSSINGSCIDILAGQYMLAGRVCFYPWTAGFVRLKFFLDDCWSLQDVSEAIKIQGYPSGPSGNPAPGRFTTYKGNGEDKGSYIQVIVPYYPFYGIHLDVQNCCEYWHQNWHQIFIHLRAREKETRVLAHACLMAGRLSLWLFFQFPQRIKVQRDL